MSRTPRWAACAAVGMAMAFAAAAPAAASTPPPTPDPLDLESAAAPIADAAQAIDTATPIKHFITLMQENHSFDNYFGTYPGADGLPAGTCMPRSTDDPAGGCVAPFALAGRPIVDLGHNVDIFKGQYRNGAMDGFLSVFSGVSSVGDLPMGYYDDRDLPFYWNVADNYVLMDRYFTSAAGGSVWNHFFWISAAPGNPDADVLLEGGFDQVPTIFDRLQQSGVSWKFYVENYDESINFRNPGNGDRGAQLVWVPILNYARFVDDPELAAHIVPLDEFYDDLANDTLPAVSYMVPSGASEHPPGSIQAGERFVRTVITSLMRSPAWSTSAFIWHYDDWGGWYDHVQPPQIDRYGYGFRTPALLVSPYAKQGVIDHTTYDFTSDVAFIEHNWRLAPLAQRDAVANDLSNAFDFSSPPRPPRFLDRLRVHPEPERPRRTIVYVCYASALALPSWLLLRGRRRRVAAAGGAR